jgi:hypothetical protein
MPRVESNTKEPELFAPALIAVYIRLLQPVATGKATALRTNAPDGDSGVK